MFPDMPQNQSSSPASLPAMPAAPQVAPVAQAGITPSAPTPEPVAGSAGVQAITQAKQLVAQYQHDPFRLSGALQQLKGAYIAEHFHVTPNTVEN